ncbi:glycosyl transferase, group 2 family protein, partial [mine drainage metagenome]
YPVEEIPRYVRYVLDHRVDFLTGNRLAYLDRKAMSTEHRIGNGILNLFLGIAYHRYLKGVADGTIADSQSGFWVFRRSVLARVALTQDGMAFSEEFKIEALLRDVKVVEVPIRYGERWGQPKLSSWQDGYRNLVFLLEKRLRVQREYRTGAPPPFRSESNSTVPPP